MPYRFAVDKSDYSDLAAGPVLYSLPGQPAFPVRLASDIFQRCAFQLERAGKARPYHLFDPCCGSAYLLTTLGFLHWRSITRLTASDIDADTVGLAARNLSLLTQAGLERRAVQLRAMLDEFHKSSHRDALASVERLQTEVRRHSHQIATHATVASALDSASLRSAIDGKAVDIVLTDVPYGQRSAWQDMPHDAGQSPEWQLLDALRAIVTPVTLIAITATKAQPIAHEAYRRVEQFQLGKRRTTLLRLM